MSSMIGCKGAERMCASCRKRTVVKQHTSSHNYLQTMRELRVDRNLRPARHIMQRTNGVRHALTHSRTHARAVTNERRHTHTHAHCAQPAHRLLERTLQVGEDPRLVQVPARATKRSRLLADRNERARQYIPR
eukprot:5613657-Pleurochrysis_carterae.AAC.7